MSTQKKLDALDTKERGVLDLYVKLTVADPAGAFAPYYASPEGSFWAAAGGADIDTVDYICRKLRKEGFIETHKGTRASIHTVYWATDAAIELVNAAGGPNLKTDGNPA